ncbi:lysophospholipid hydrolase [Nematocida homosporus]|uniref:lysophospholipid hydrolase n=1 Tax=Nematocida homosporus TaxID=1912981 RepID=UPI00221ECD5F|nr:lysophospholipid hydrolase [Nematocida homosporus]KAI5184990.1 lysophospholipid hydrolase [Nematocida homosporus]
MLTFVTWSGLESQFTTIFWVVGMLVTLVTGFVTYRAFKRSSAVVPDALETEEIVDVSPVETSGLFAFFADDTSLFGPAATTTRDIVISSGEVIYYLVSGLVEVHYRGVAVVAHERDFFATTTQWIVNPLAKSEISYVLKAKSVFYHTSQLTSPELRYVLLTKFFRGTLYTLLNYAGAAPEPYDLRTLPDAADLAKLDDQSLLAQLQKNVPLGRRVKSVRRQKDPVHLSPNGVYLVLAGQPTLFYGEYSRDVEVGCVFGVLNRVSRLEAERRLVGECEVLEVIMGAPDPRGEGLLAIAKEYVDQASDILQITDASVHWRIIQPGERISVNQPSRSVKIVGCGYFLKEGDIKYFGIGSGRILFEREAVLGLESPYIAIATRCSEIIEIPPAYITAMLTLFHEAAPRLYRGALSRATQQEHLDRPRVIVFAPADPVVTQIEIFTHFLNAEINQSDTCTVLSSTALEKGLGPVYSSSSAPVAIISLLSYLQSEYSYVLLPIVAKPAEDSTTAALRLAEIVFYLVVNGDSLDSEIERVWCKVDTVVLHRDSKKQVVGGRWRGQRHHLEFPSIDVPASVVIGFSEKEEYAHRTHCAFTEASPHPLVPVFPLSDMKRFLRTLKGENVGLVLGGGGARGIAHIGIIQALEEAGIPIDAVGGTSMGAFVGALYAIGCNNAEVFSRAKKFARLFGSIWHIVMDLTYPICSMFSGKTFNWVLTRIFKKRKIEDLWLPYYCVTTDILKIEERVHKFGLLWRYVRASMSLSGYLPPLCDRDSFLLDGGYVNNVPADAMRSMGIRNIIAVDVGSEVDSNYYNYGDSLNGFYILFQKLFGTKRFLSLTEIQYRLSYITSSHKEKSLRSDVSVKYIRPDLTGYKTMNFGQFDEIVAHGYQHGRKVIEEWKKTGEFDELTQHSRIQR